MTGFTEEVKPALEALGIGEVVVEASAIMGSPHDWVYILLGDGELFDFAGPVIIVSPLEEYEQRTGYLVGAANNPEAEDPEEYADLDAAVEAARLLAERTPS